MDGGEVTALLDAQFVLPDGVVRTAGQDHALREPCGCRKFAKARIERDQHVSVGRVGEVQLVVEVSGVLVFLGK